MARTSAPGKADIEHSRTPAGDIRSFPTESIALGVCRLLNGEFDRA